MVVLTPWEVKEEFLVAGSLADRLWGGIMKEIWFNFCGTLLPRRKCNKQTRPLVYA